MKRLWVLVPAMAVVLTGGCASLRAPSTGVVTTTHVHVAAARFTPTPSSQAMYDVLVAEMAGQSGNAKMALEYYRKAMKILPDPSLAERTMAVATFLHDDDVALEAAQRWAALDPDKPQPQQALGFLYARRGDIDNAALHLRRFIDSSGQKRGHALIVVGALLAQTVPADRALSVMRRVIEAYPKQGEAYYAYGLLALELGAPATALDAADRALQLQPAMDQAVSLKATSLMMLGHQGQALDLLDHALDRNPGSLTLHLAYARLLVQAKHYSRARVEFSWLLKRDPNNPDVLYTLGLLDFELKRDQEARLYLNRLAKAGDHVSAAQYFLGRIAERSGDMGGALNHYANVAAGQYLFDAQVRIAYILARQGDLDQAREYLTELRDSVSGKQQKIELYLVEGELLQQADDAPSALRLYTRALREYPGTARLLYARALIAASLGDLGRAEADLKALIRANPKDAAALNALGYTLADHTNRYVEALGYIKRALALEPGSPAVLDSMGWVQFKLKHYDQARHYLEQAYAKLQDPVVVSHLIQALVASGRRDQAESLLAKAFKVHPNDPTLTAMKRRLGL